MWSRSAILDTLWSLLSALHATARSNLCHIRIVIIIETFSMYAVRMYEPANEYHCSVNMALSR